MTLKFDTYEIEIKAKGLHGEDYNVEDTLNVLNYISILCSEAGDWNKEHGYHDGVYRDNAKQLFDFCMANGLYSIKEDD